MLSPNFKPKRTAAASLGFLATARLSCFILNLRLSTFTVQLQWDMRVSRPRPREGLGNSRPKTKTLRNLDNSKLAKPGSKTSIFCAQCRAYTCPYFRGISPTPLVTWHQHSVWTSHAAIRAASPYRTSCVEYLQLTLPPWEDGGTGIWGVRGLGAATPKKPTPSSISYRRFGCQRLPFCLPPAPAAEVADDAERLASATPANVAVSLLTELWTWWRLKLAAAAEAGNSVGDWPIFRPRMTCITAVDNVYTQESAIACCENTPWVEKKKQDIKLLSIYLRQILTDFYSSRATFLT